jgi:hypothetical protein
MGNGTPHLTIDARRRTSPHIVQVDPDAAIADTTFWIGV